MLLFVAIVATAAVLAGFGNNAWAVWMGGLVPERIRGRFFSQRMVSRSLSGTAASLAAGLLLDRLGGRGLSGEGLAGLAAVACVAGASSVLLLRRQHDPGPARGAGAGDWRDALAALSDARARALVLSDRL